MVETGHTLAEETGPTFLSLEPGESANVSTVGMSAAEVGALQSLPQPSAAQGAERESVS